MADLHALAQAIARLSPEERQELDARLAPLGRSNPEAPAAVRMLYEVGAELLDTYGLKVPPLAVYARTPGFRRFERCASAVSEYVDANLSPERLPLKRAAVLMIAHEVLRGLEAARAPLSLRAMAGALGTQPESVARWVNGMFPGYAKAGLLPLLFRRK